MFQSYASELRKLEPLTLLQGYEYLPAKWLQLSQPNRALISDFENKTIRRADIILNFADHFSNQTSFLRCFLLTMVWGYGTAGYGAIRTQNCLASQANIDQIKSGIEAMAAGDRMKSFRHLSLVKGLGISYISKLMYFAGRALKLQQYPVILDRKVAQTLARLSLRPIEIYSMLSISPSQTYTGYQAYCSFVHTAAASLHLQADTLEYFLFCFGSL